MCGLACLARAHAAANHRNDGKANGRARHVHHAGNAVGNGVGRHGRGAKGGNQVQHHQLACLEHAVFQPVGNAHEQNALNHVASEFKVEHTLHAHGVAFVVQHDHNDDGGGNARGQRANARPGRAHAKAVDENGVDGNVDDIHHQRAEHGNAAVAHGPEQRRARVVYAHEGVGGRGNQKIHQGTFHHVCLYMAENQA